MKLSDIPVDDIQLVKEPEHTGPLKLSQVNPNDVQADEPGALSDAATGFSRLGGMADVTAGAAQGLPDWLMGAAHNVAPGLINASPTQVNAALQRLGVKGDVGPTSAKALYRESEEAQQAKENAAKQRSPTAYGAGSLAGDVAAFVPLTAATPEIAGAEGIRALTGAPSWLAKAGASAINMAPSGAAIGAMGSQGHLINATPQEQGQVLNDAKHGAETASLLGAGTSLLGSAAKGLAGAPQAQDLASYYKLGKEGTDLSSETQQLGSLSNPESLEHPVSLHETQQAQYMLDDINKADDYLGQQVGQVVDNATKQGINISLEPHMSEQIDQVFKNLPSVDVGPEGLDVSPSPDFSNDTLKPFYEIVNKFKTEGLTPVEMQEFRNDLGDMGRKIYNKDPAQAAELFDLSSNLTKSLKDNVPGYAPAADRLSEFRRSIPETILSKDNPQDVTQMRMSGTRNVDTKLLNNLKNMISGLYNPNNTVARGSYSNLLQNLQKLNASELAKKASGDIDKTIFDHIGIQPEQIEQVIKQAGYKSKLIQDYTGTSAFDLAKPVESAKKLGSWAANKIGKAVGTGSAAQNPVLQTGTKLYSAPAEDLQALSQKINMLPGQKPLAQALDRAIQNNDGQAKNAILFSIMQNPNLRNLVDSEALGVGIK